MILIDTHVLIWAIEDPSKISPKAVKIIEKNIKTESVLISSVSIWEICNLVKNKGLSLKLPIREWVVEVENLPFVKFLALGNSFVHESVYLPGKFHKDPADRFIVASARLLKIPLITADKKILQYRHVRTIW